MDTTVIIPNFNGKKYLKKCLDSATKSTVNASIIVVDNGSKDGSAEWVQRHYPDVRVILFPENRGFSAAVNAGIRVSDTPYVFLLNNDAYVKPDCIGKLEETMKSGERIFSVGAKMLSMDRPDIVDTAGDLYSAFGWAYAIGKGKKSSRYQKPLPVFSNCAGAALYRKALLDRTGLFDEAHFVYLEDVDVGYRARIMGFKNVTQPAAVVYHAGSASSGSRHNAFKIAHSSRNSVYLIYKNMPFLQILLNLPFLTAGFLIKLLYFTAKGYGRVYAAGLINGIRLCAADTGKSRRVRFASKYMGNYIHIQLDLWINLFRRL